MLVYLQKNPHKKCRSALPLDLLTSLISVILLHSMNYPWPSTLLLSSPLLLPPLSPPILSLLLFITVLDQSSEKILINNFFIIMIISVVSLDLFLSWWASFRSTLVIRPGPVFLGSSLVFRPGPVFLWSTLVFGQARSFYEVALLFIHAPCWQVGELPINHPTPDPSVIPCSFLSSVNRIHHTEDNRTKGCWSIVGGVGRK